MGPDQLFPTRVGAGISLKAVPQFRGGPTQLHTQTKWSHTFSHVQCKRRTCVLNKNPAPPGIFLLISPETPTKTGSLQMAVGQKYVPNMDPWQMETCLWSPE